MHPRMKQNMTDDRKEPCRLKPKGGEFFYFFNLIYIYISYDQIVCIDKSPRFLVMFNN